MSGTDHHDDVDCEKLLGQVFFYIDQELDEAATERIRQHIGECAPCLDEVAIERLVKKLIARSCKEQAPVELRQRVVFSIRQVQLELRQTRLEAE
ncbi:MAG TPA: mycothiol system anti-sigma-R factor [Nocardioidaceae bacterium]|nr:mycothiol system anti-sigma-R factor [Nocardioidaceae bacterium]